MCWRKNNSESACTGSSGGAYLTVSSSPFSAAFAIFPDREIVMVPARDILLGGGISSALPKQQPKVEG
jgi:hypothetical protein